MTKAQAHAPLTMEAIGCVGRPVGTAESISACLTSQNPPEAWLLRRYVTLVGSSCDRAESTHILSRIKIALPKISRCTLLLRQRALYYRMTALTLWMHVYGPRRT